MHLRLLVLLLALSLAMSACTVAFRLTDTGLSIDWPRIPSLPLPLPAL